MELGWRGKIAMVTGASKGIGKAMAEALAAESVGLARCARGVALLEEVAALAVLLASDRASYINGVAIPVDGGTIRCI